MHTIIGFIISCSLLISSTWAAQPVSGEFIATQSCQAFQSKRKQTNPDATQLQPGNRYRIIQANRPENADWYRIEISTANPRQRWVNINCGDIQLTTKPTPYDNNRCSLPGLEDSYLLAVSWQPAFCERRARKAECQVKDPQSYQARHFSLHGLWPNKSSCGKNYGYCDATQGKQKNFCDYPELQLEYNTRQQLNQLMPSAAHGSCLQRHEWFKHGSCQQHWNMDQYYQLAMRLLNEFNGQGANSLSAFIQQRIEQPIRIDKMNQKVDQLFGNNAHKRLQYLCDNKKQLVDIYINLPQQLTQQPLSELIQQAPPNFNNRCGDYFVIDAIND